MRPVLPPYAHWLGVTAERDGGGAPLFRLAFTPIVAGRPGFVHGGALGGLLEIAALGTLLDRFADEPAPPRIKPISVSIDYLRGATEHETMAAATIVRLGKRIANVEARAWQDDPARIVAAARMTLMLRRPAG